MNVLYLGSFFPEDRYAEIQADSLGVIQNAGDTYQKAILLGLLQYFESFKIITSPMIGGYPKRYKKLLFKNSSFEFNGIRGCICSGFNNLTLYKNVSRYKYIKKELTLWLNDNRDKKKTIIVYSMDISLLRVISEVKNDYNDIHICLIVTDLIEYMIVPRSLLSNYIMRYINKKANQYLKVVDSFVLLTEYMKDKLMVGRRPYVIVEGIYNDSIINKNIVKEVNKTILYTGTLARVYGIIHLLDAFDKIKNQNYRLWICGEGDSKIEILKRIKADNRIKYYGQLPREEVISLQKRATVLINPRLSDSEFTKYSFASKTMEYLASGTPTIMHPLKCLSNDYLKHMYVARDESDNGLMNKIIEVCEKSQEELNQFGQLAATFIVSKKNSYIQVGRIMKMLNNEK